MIGRSRHRRIKKQRRYERLAATRPVIPCGNFSDTSSFKFRRSKGSLGPAFTVRIRTGNQNQTSFYPSVPHEISVLVELILGHLRYLLTDVPPQPTPHLTMSSARIGLPRQALVGFPLSVPVLSWLFDARGRPPKEPFPVPSPGRHAATRSRRGSSSSSPPTADGFGTGTPVPSPQSQSFSRGYGSILPTSLAYIVPSTRGCSPWRPDAVMSTTGRGRHSVLRIFKGRRGRTGHRATCGGSSSRWTLPPTESLTAQGFAGDRRALLLIGAWHLPRRPGVGRALKRHPFSGLVDSADERFARQYRCGPPTEFPLASPRSGIVHHLRVPTGMLTLEPFSEDQGRSAVHPARGIPPISFLAPCGFTHPLTRTHVLVCYRSHARYLALDGNLPALLGLHSQTTRLADRRPRGATGSGHGPGLSPLWRPLPGTWARSAAEDASPDYNSDSEAVRFSSWADPGSLAVTKGILEATTNTHTANGTKLDASSHLLFSLAHTVPGFVMVSDYNPWHPKWGNHKHKPTGLPAIGQRPIPLTPGYRYMFTGRSALQGSTMILPAGSPTETLLRLLLPLNDKVQWNSRDVRRRRNRPRRRDPNTSPDHSIGRSDGRCVQRAGT
ncbi:hypothetical protein L1887_57406 [Cichorium endivia]|nr:hypothetical protein L1887_57406 [Cichorium endivia]